MRGANVGAICGVGPPATVANGRQDRLEVPFHAAIAACCCACALTRPPSALRCLSRPSQTHQHIERRNTPAMKAAEQRTQPRCANGGFTGTGSCRGARAGFFRPVPCPCP